MTRINLYGKLTGRANIFSGIFTVPLVTAGLLLCPVISSGQRLPAAFSEKAGTPAVSSLPGLLATEEGVDKEIEHIKALEEKLFSEGAAPGRAAGGIGMAASPDEISEEERKKANC